MEALYNVFTGRDDQHYFNLTAANHEIILQSEGYVSEQGALKGVNSVQKNCTDDDNYERRVAKDGSPYFVLKAENGKIIGRSETYSSKQAMEKGIDSVKRNGPSPTVKGIKVNIFKIFLNNRPFLVLKKEIKGSDLLKLYGISSGRYCLFLLKKTERVEVQLQEEVRMRSGLRFQIVRND